MKIERDIFSNIVVEFEDGSFIKSQSVEANLLYEILNKLEEIRCGIIDVESAVNPR